MPRYFCLRSQVSGMWKVIKRYKRFVLPESGQKTYFFKTEYFPEFGRLSIKSTRPKIDDEQYVPKEKKH